MAYKKYLVYFLLFQCLFSCINDDEPLQKVYYSNGALKREYTVINDTTIHGNWKEYYTDGKLKSKGKWTFGKWHGLFSFYTPDGSLEMTASYANGKQNGITKAYHPNKSLKFIGYYTNGLNDGKNKYYYPNGVLRGIDFIHLDTLYFNILYNEDGSIKKREYHPVFIANSDTIYLGDTLFAKASLYNANKLKNPEVAFTTRKAEDKWKKMADPPVFKFYSGRFEYKYVPLAPGDYITGAVVVFKDDTDSQFHYIWHHEFIVLPKRSLQH